MAGRRRARANDAPRAPRVRPPPHAKAAPPAAAPLLSPPARTPADPTPPLIPPGAPPPGAQAVVADMIGRGYVDDAAFARHFVETRASRGYGAARLAADLRAKGVPPAFITAALAPLDTEAQLDRARAVARRRLPALRKVAPE